MAKFSYTGRDASGTLTQGEIDASDANAAAKMLRTREVVPLTIEEAAASGGLSLDVGALLQQGVSLGELVIFCRQMYSLTKAGIPIMRAVAGLAESTSSRNLKRALQDVMVQLERGRTLSSALHLHPRVFNQLFVSIIHVGENTGQLEQAFEQLASYLEREQETRKQINAATRYPLFVAIALVAAFVILNMFVIPKFAALFAKFNAELPAMTKGLIATSDFMQTYWGWLLLACIAAVYLLRRYLQTERGRFRWDRRKLRLPVIGSIFNRSLLGRYCRSFAMMLRAGVPLTTALSLTAEAVDNAYMARKINVMRENIERGESLSRVSHASGMFTPMVMQMVRVGEETGQVDELLVEVSEFYEREVDYDLKSLTAKIEPILIVVVAVMVLILALGIFMPMWDMMNAIRGR